MANSPEITCSKSTVYRHFHKGYYSASLIDLPRAVKFKARKARKEDYVPSGLKIGRSYDEFLVFVEENNLCCHVELDTVIGRVGGKVIMTVHFTSCNFMIGLLMDNKSAAEGAMKFSALKSRLREAGISIPDLFGVLLCDNGGEFADVFSFENDDKGNKELSLFFCDPMRSSQKPQIEKNHTLFRDIVPKGSSFDDFTQDTVDLIFSHVNSVSRKIYAGKTSLDMFSFVHGESIASLMGISRIPPKDVNQSPELLKGIADLTKNL
jgi:IS30 family transposase